MCLVRTDIEDGPTREEFDKQYAQHGKMYFKIEGEYYPHRINDAKFLKNECVKLLGYTLTGLFIAEYDFRTKHGSLITKYGRIVDDI